MNGINWIKKAKNPERLTYLARPFFTTLSAQNHAIAITVSGNHYQVNIGK
jgi:hypothetical protein